jgi:hypothetical protein
VKVAVTRGRRAVVVEWKWAKPCWVLDLGREEIIRGRRSLSKILTAEERREMGQ